MIRYAAVALVLLVWGAVKLPWETHLADRRRQIMYGQEQPFSFRMRDSLGQGLTLAALGGFRGVAANFVWISLTMAWEEQQWTRVRTLAEFAVLLQPRVLFFWENGAWHLAWNASVSAQNYPRPDSTPNQRLRESRQWIEAGRDMLERAIQANPEKPQIYMRMAELYQQRLQDQATAARYYMMAASKPGASPLAERFAGYALENAGRPQEAYDYWIRLWRSSDEHPEVGPRQWPKIRERIQKLENELNIPDDKRLFPR
jgi:tetratricopeptide (TPR) repeat protein